MVTLRATRKVLQRLPPVSADDARSGTALGDWYVNRIVVARQPLLLLVSSHSLLPIIEPARQILQLPKRLPGLVRQRLLRSGVPNALIEREIAAMHPVLVGPTRDRSVLGTLVDFARILPYCLPEGGWGELDLHLAESRLAEMPCRVTTPRRATLFPRDTALRLLDEAWGKAHRAIH